MNVQIILSYKIWSGSINSILPRLFSNNGGGNTTWKGRERKKRRPEILPAPKIIFGSSPDILLGKSESFVSSFSKIVKIFLIFSL